MINRVIFFGVKLFIPLIIVVTGCKTRKFDSPPGYDFSAPVTIKLKHGLREISGISFCGEKEQSLSAIEDEHGKLYEVQLPGGEFTSYRFGDNGDYEDLACWKNKIFVLKSNGKLTSFSIPGKESAVSNIEINDSLLPQGEYEGIALHKDTLYVLCKVCGGFDAAEALRIYRIAISDNGSLSGAGLIEPKISIKKEGKEKPERIHPSCLARNPADNNWYIISSANKLIMIFDENFNLINNYRLDPALFAQPEGLAFKTNGDMLISNEGGDGDANIRVFNYMGK
jgi:hypothetical protein